MTFSYSHPTIPLASLDSQQLQDEETELKRRMNNCGSNIAKCTPNKINYPHELCWAENICKEEDKLRKYQKHLGQVKKLSASKSA
jgi:hypothetical protein